MTYRPLRLSLILVGLLLLFAGIGLWRGDGAWDMALHRAWLLDPGDLGVGPARALTAVGGLAALGPLALVVALWLWWRGRVRDAGWLVLVLTGGRLIVEGAKLLARRPRPPLADHLDTVSSWSFPSSHSAGTMMTCLAFAVIAGGRWPVVVALTAAGLVGWSRIALGVHWPSDVLAGWGFGLAWIGFWMRQGGTRQGGPMRSG